MYRTILIIASTLIFCSAHSFAQVQMTDIEIQDFFKQIKQTKEYKQLKTRTDSANTAQHNISVQELEIKIVKRADVAVDENIATADIDKSVIGMTVEGYTMRYNKQKKQIVSIQKKESRFQLN
ncbi:MAG: hypothetical protein JWQ38_1015 [Flavipsychrobacter sp.]|nr:hypothetical protein [Flavipsychrobacter sp.]